MQTSLTEEILGTIDGKEADAILRKCVHCGFCNATCPTYQLLGDELDGPRGRIYLIKAVLEGHGATRATQMHLDRCLSCRACETTCPSGVQYGRLADIGRAVTEGRVTRTPGQRWMRRLLRAVIPHRRRFAGLLAMGRLLRPLLPAAVRRQIPPRQASGTWPAPRHRRWMLLATGCVQPALAPNIDAAAARVLDYLGISLVPAVGGGCCGAVSQHLAAPGEALEFARRNIDAWWPALEQGAEAVVITASGCGLMAREYGHLLQYDADYADKAVRVSAAVRDLCQVLESEDLAKLGPAADAPRRIAFQSPCTLQHGLRLAGVTESLLRRLGFELTAEPDPHLCCGSAGTYSLLQPALSERLLAEKLQRLTAGGPALIATANIGCYTHLTKGSSLPVRHWIELLGPRGEARK